MSLKRGFRIMTLVAPPWGAWYVASTAKGAPELYHLVGLALGPLWAILTAALVLRMIGVAFAAPNERVSRLDQVDVLTGSGAALAWSSAIAIALAARVGWASLAVVGLLGTGVFHIVVAYSLLVVRGADPMRGATTVRRRFTPDGATEGDELVEEIRFDGTRIPLGFRLFAEGRIGPRWGTSRHVLDTTASGGEVVVETAIGPALRGEHEAEPLVLWLEDTFGLTRSPRVPVGGQRLTVLPRVRPVDAPKALVERGMGPRAPKPEKKLPTEGHFHLREYQQGDDVRRIHWVRSLASRELIVRMPDEIPPDRPEVRLVLDTWFPEALVLDCDATASILDALVAVWLAAARSLAEAGARVTLVSAVPAGESLRVEALETTRRDPSAAAKLGARVTWQGQVQVQQMLTEASTFIVSRAVLETPEPCAAHHWIIVVPEVEDVTWNAASAARLPFPMGLSDNRWSRWRKATDALAKRRFDHGRALLALRNASPPPRGTLAAQPRGTGTIHLEVIA